MESLFDRLYVLTAGTVASLKHITMTTPSHLMFDGFAGLVTQDTTGFKH
jgi:hypothetical protein